MDRPPRNGSSRRQFLTRGALVGLLSLGTRVSIYGESRWPDERTAGPFHFHADYALDDASLSVDELAELQVTLAEQLHIRPTSDTIHLFLFRKEATYLSYMKHYFPKAPSRRAMYIKQRGQGMVFAQFSGELPADLRHECTHAILHGALPMVPLWLDEGLAEYYEVPPALRAAHNPYLSSIQWRVRFGHHGKLESLEKLGALQEMGRGEYRDAWGWVHFMLHGPNEALEELRGFLADIAAHSPPGRLSERLQRRIPDLRQSFVDHFQSWA